MKSIGNSSIFVTWLYSQGRNIYVPSIWSLSLFFSFCHMFGSHRKLSARLSLLMFGIDRLIARISSSLVLYWVPRSGSFTLELHIPAAPPSSSAQEKTMSLYGTEPHHS